MDFDMKTKGEHTFDNFEINYLEKKSCGIKTPKVSIIMGIYNCEKTLSAAIESIVSQTYANWELIMCDDGSKDNTYEVAKRYRAKYPEKIILLRNETNMKLAFTLNCCLEVASGEYIARMDADDMSLPQRIEKEVKFLECNSKIACVGTGCVIFDDKGDNGIRMCKENPTKMAFVHGTPFAHPTIMMRKEVYDKLGGYTSSEDTLRAEDLDLWFRFFSHGYQGYVIQEPLYRYRESLSDFKRRSFQAAVGTTKVYLHGYKLLEYPFYVYPYAFKPIIAALVPKRLMYLYHLKKDNKVK